MDDDFQLELTDCNPSLSANSTDNESVEEDDSSS